jgi:hypothetical protein
MHCRVNIFAAQEYPSLILQIPLSLHEQFAAFCLFMGTLPKKLALLGANGNTCTLKLETTPKL